MSWKCPHCNTAAFVHDDDFKDASLELFTGDNLYRYTLVGISCPNPSCLRASVNLKIQQLGSMGGVLFPFEDSLQIRSLIPSGRKSRAKTYPSYVPESVLSDYQEACAIADLSPKASATLARRCLQGMIRNFWEIEADTLNNEILAIEDRVDPMVWDAIDSVRKVGNIGAHMEKDINVIVDVNSEEANLLIEVIEMLLDDWYVARHEKQEKLKRIKDVASAKSAARKGKTDEKTAPN
ncbi:DUF4145 domain-containing protein [Enterobacter hormaechei]|uniref:DUF4145 domain-containing protein n=1 Tax=Enterobacter hormaechei TaxID=158836 RepID=UPI0007B3389A|nr:DUF4145 domain-containing protein [Enterobacter hormaechei]RTM57431.1 DUF4145 domain-containing protein [Enterobacter hormaechei subsp. xiangfangensis]